MNDNSVMSRINALAEEEESLWARGGDGTGLASSERRRLEEIGVELDQCYDFLRQRQARREAGLDPDDARVRAPAVVEGYEQ